MTTGEESPPSTGERRHLGSSDRPEIALLDFLEDYYRLSHPPVTDIRDYKAFLLRDGELPESEAVQLTPSGGSWLAVRLEDLPVAPEIPDDLAGWLAADALSPHSPPALRPPASDEIDSPELGDVLTRWTDSTWRPWSELWAEVENGRRFYKKLFALRMELERNRDGLQLVWGFGRLTAPDRVDYPPITIPVELSLADDGVLRIEPDGAAQIETACVSGVELVDRSQWQILRLAQAADDLDLWDETSRRDLFSRLLRAADHDARLDAGVSASGIAMMDEWVLFARRPEADFPGFLDRQRKLYEAGIDPTLPFMSLVVDEPSLLLPTDEFADFGPSDAVPEPLDHTMFLPKAANEEQHRILKLALSHAGVTAQGPPGTGKSHTIANLICHFVAQGQRVVVTAAKEQALGVLSDKLPVGIRSLSVSVLGSDDKSRQRLRHAIGAIQEKVSTFDPSWTDSEISRLSGEISEIDAAINEKTNALRSARAVEATEIQGRFEAGTNPKPSDAAKWVSDHQELGIIPDEIGAGVPLPVSADEWADICHLARTLRHEDIAQIRQDRPDGSRLPTGSELASRWAESEERHRTLSEAEGFVEDWSLVDESPPEAFSELSIVLESATEWRKSIAGTWLDSIRSECLSPISQGEWNDFLDACASDYQAAITHRKAIAADQIVIPPSAPDDALMQALAEAHKRYSEGKGLPRLGAKPTVELIRACRVNGRPPASARDISLCIAACRRRQAQRRLWNRWHQTTSRIGGPQLDHAVKSPEDAVGPMLDGVRNAISWHCVSWPELSRRLHAVGVRSGDSPDVDQLAQLAEATAKLVLRAAERSNDEYLGWLRSYLAPQSGQSTLWDSLARALEDRRSADWENARTECIRLASLEPDVARLESLAQNLRRVAPVFTETVLADSVNAPDFAIFSRAFEWRTLDCRIAGLLSGTPPDVLQRDLDVLSRRRLSVMEDLVSAKAVVGLVASFTDKKRAALNKYITAVDRYGKTGGKYKERWTREIRQALDESKDAVPIWIMPVHRLISSFQPDETPPFDVLIVDEASQIGLAGLPVLSLARKAIVVGDDQQTSPENVGINQGQVHELISTHLPRIKNAVTLFDAENSLYDVSKQKFPDVVSLREHFRCLPDIIGFSNARYYGGRMIVLRDRPPRPGWEAVKTLFIPDGVRDGRDINEQEALAIAQIVKDICSDPAYVGMSIGVVTLLGSAQSQRIQELLLETLGPVVLEERDIRCGEAPAFQGDERDVVLVSTVVDATSRIGAMTDRRSERRINVAASRAKEQMWVVHSVPAEDFPSADPRAELIRHCQNPRDLDEIGKVLTEKCESQFERDVVADIVARGFRKVRVQHEVGRFRIDILVEGPDGSLAIECDGDAWHGPERWDQDRARQQILERAGYTFEHVRGSAYYRHRNKALDHVWRRLEEIGIPTGEWWNAGIPSTAIGTDMSRLGSERIAYPKPPVGIDVAGETEIPGGVQVPARARSLGARAPHDTEGRPRLRKKSSASNDVNRKPPHATHGAELPERSVESDEPRAIRDTSSSFRSPKVQLDARQGQHRKSADVTSVTQESIHDDGRIVQPRLPIAETQSTQETSMSMKIQFKVDRDTKNTIRYAETEDQPDGHPGYPVVGTLYLQKAAYAQMGKPETILVTIEPSSSKGS